MKNNFILVIKNKKQAFNVWVNLKGDFTGKSRIMSELFKCFGGDQSPYYQEYVRWSGK